MRCHMLRSGSTTTINIGMNSIYYILSHTLSLMPNSSRTWANIAAKLTPKCNFATSTRSRSMEMGMPWCPKWTVISMYALWLGNVHASVAKLRVPLFSYKVCCQAVYFTHKTDFTCSIFATCWWTYTKTSLTSQDTVSAEGMWKSGHLVFINIWNPWSLTTWNGHLLSAIQWMISVLTSS